jgi:hypothetical protein
VFLDTLDVYWPEVTPQVRPRPGAFAASREQCLGKSPLLGGEDCLEPVLPNSNRADNIANSILGSRKLMLATGGCDDDNGTT